MKESILYSGIDEELPKIKEAEDDLMKLGCRIVLPPTRCLQNSLNKDKTFELLKADFKQPKTKTSEGSTYQQLLDFFEENERSIRLKRADARGNRENYLISDLRKLKILIDDYLNTDVPFILQENISGEEFNVSVLLDKDEMNYFQFANKNSMLFQVDLTHRLV